MRVYSRLTAKKVMNFILQISTLNGEQQIRQY